MNILFTQNPMLCPMLAWQPAGNVGIVCDCKPVVIVKTVRKVKWLEDS